MTVILVFLNNLFYFLNEKPFRTNQSKRQISWKKSGFVDSGFVKTCDEFVIGLVALQNSKHLLPQWMQLASNIPPILELSSENLRTMIYIVQAYIVLAPNEFVATCGASVMKPLDEQYGK